MSSNEDSEPAVKHKARPCDVCRRRKRDGGTPCGRCIEHKASCTYEKGAMRRTNTISSRYIQSLEARLKRLDACLRESNVHPESPASSPTSATDSPAGVELIIRTIRTLNDPFPVPNSKDIADSPSLNNSGSHSFQGRSSQASLLKAAVDLRATQSIVPSNPSHPAVPLALNEWGVKPAPTLSRPTYTFPEDDLTISLISLYFDHINIFFPLLNRPIFEEGVAGTLHLRDNGFAGTLLLVCALGALYSDDLRVKLAAVATNKSPGWEWFSQVHFAGQPFSDSPTLFDLQSYCLAVQFLDRSSGARACWTLVGFGIRLAQDIGAHRLKTRTPVVRPEAELEKRVYWLMIVLDIQFSGALGRFFAIQSHEFNQDLPDRCDDEYWAANPRNTAFCQPPETPSRVDFFISLLKLNRILGFTLKVMYSSNRIKALTGMSDATSQAKIVAEFDSVLNAWFDSLPPHLRWDPASPNDVFFDQSAALHCSYYYVRILIHRPFIPAIQTSAVPTTFPALSICNNAARACIHVADIQHRRRPNNPLVFAQTAVFTASIVLLLNIWGSKRTISAATDLSDVHRCMSILRGHQTRWPSTAPLLDTLEQLMKVDQAPRTSPREDYGPLPFVTGSVRAPPLERTYDNLHCDPTMPGLFVDVVREEPPRSSGWNSSAPLDDESDPANMLDFMPVHGGRMDLDTVAMWSAAPTSFEVSDWDLYLNDIADMIHEYPFETPVK
ncbi:fungal-specific transcription factor domain-containing protein [Mycena rosella]|uniref:Fungal-specific transcription factor domain-containing protein n=1 Tax=Mycena rosella TaxID=1033263 RepID=A0AAD7GK72_MYCRO|nr:fungal-specific transcription factor domain-containing protein [Mycena rosella]